MPENIIIRQFLAQDRERLRRISVHTAFHELPPGTVFSDDEVLADALTLYYTDYEPQSCFVAACENKVIGYIIGTTDVLAMERASAKMMFPQIFWKALRRGVFLRARNLKFLFYCLRSACAGELAAPHFSKEYPAMLHINIEYGYRTKGIGEKLIKAFETYLKDKKSAGVHFGSISDKAKNFFVKMGYKILFQGKRTYLKPYLGKEVNFYVFGKRF